MKIIVGHANMDLDCIGSIVLAKYIFPDHIPVKSYLVHPVARNLMNLYEKRLGFATTADLKGQQIERIVVVDTRSVDRIAEYVRGIEAPGGIEYEVFDHHPADSHDIPGATIHERAFGANTTQLGLELISRGIPIAPEDATIALTGIYADTGNFTHNTVTREDFEVAAFLLAQGASLKLVKDFLVPLKEKQQIVLFHEILNILEKRFIRGHQVQTCYLELDDEAQGLGAVIEQVFEVENLEILFGFFFFRKKAKLLIIARNNDSRVCLNEILSDFGGGGHKQAASATIKTEEGTLLVEGIIAYLDRILAPAITARQIMTETVVVLSPEHSLMEASKILESVSHTGAPVVDENGKLIGFLTLRDIMNGRKGNQMHVPVRTYMTKTIVSATPDTTVRELSEVLFEHNIGHIPIVNSDRVVGIVTRADILDFKKTDQLRRSALLSELGVPDLATASA
jgi:tRNA nucleotidyltransferase (CCA-adding enzyme)